MLRQLPKPNDANLLVGIETSDDAAVYRLTDDLALVQTVDYFTPVVDDPYAFGAIAAANSLSDIYAMGGRPILALNLSGFPVGRLPLDVLSEILRGGWDKAAEAGVTVAGGHSIDDPEPKYGMAVTGLIDPRQIVANRGARAGDVIVLTKPIGTGIIATALKAGRATPEAVRGATETMSALNKGAAEAMLKVSVHACTDVTGFGLLGHLHEMIAASGVGAQVYQTRVPLLTASRELAVEGFVPGGTKRNLGYFQQHIDWATGIDPVDQLLLLDAQTSGGLLIAVAADRCAELLDALEQAGTPARAIVGEITGGPVGRISVRP